MQCPVCPDTTLVMTNRESIEIDYCPKCRGVWLDRGELDKVIERSVPEVQPRAASYDREHSSREHRGYGDRDHDHRRYKKKSPLAELFDF